jgi:hypothetical protein
MEERRRSVRHRTLKGGRILFDGGSSSRDCVIRDISDGGAKLCFPSVVGIPSELLLAFDDGRPSRECFSKWRRPTAMGVEFLLAF